MVCPLASQTIARKGIPAVRHRAALRICPDMSPPPSDNAVQRDLWYASRKNSEIFLLTWIYAVFLLRRQVGDSCRRNKILISHPCFHEIYVTIPRRCFLPKRSSSVRKARSNIRVTGKGSVDGRAFFLHTGYRPANQAGTLFPAAAPQFQGRAGYALQDTFSASHPASQGIPEEERDEGCAQENPSFRPRHGAHPL